MADNRYLKLLAKEYPNAQAAACEIINLKAITCLPKGTEFFFSDLHGEYGAFLFQLHSASGVVRKKIDELFEQSISEEGRAALARLIYYPDEEISLAKKKESGNFEDWCRVSIYRLVELCREAASKYTRSKVRKKLPPAFAYIIDELLHADGGKNKAQYSNGIIRAIVETGMGPQFIAALCRLIRQLLVDRLHIIGDIFDRGPHADKIMDMLHGYDVDIQWGNHDISWMGAAAGNLACIASVIRLGISYNNFDQLEDGYGINLRPLSAFAEKAYRDDPCECFQPHLLDKNLFDPVDIPLAAKMHKAIAVIQFKVEGRLIQKHPEYGMDDRVLLNKIDYKNGTVLLDGKTYPLRDRSFPTVDPDNPLELTREETELMKTLSCSFRHSERLQKHIGYLYSHGGMYRCVNSNLLYHGCIPMTEDGRFAPIPIDGKTLSGRKYLEYLDAVVRSAYFAPEGSAERENACDLMWYLWCGRNSPVFGKSKLATFERYFIDDRGACAEVMNPYYSCIESRKTCETILREFGLDPSCSHIINGHVPVRLKQGESPVKGRGLLFMIDGGISKAYQKQTGIGGYTFIANSRYLALAEHKPLKPGSLVEEGSPKVKVVEAITERVTVGDTDTGRELKRRIEELTALLESYRSGLLQEN